MTDDTLLSLTFLLFAGILGWYWWRARMRRTLQRPPPAYLAQDSGQTLREGLAEYYAGDPELLRAEQISRGMRPGLLAHDAAHVVFGCDTTARGAKQALASRLRSATRPMSADT